MLAKITVNEYMTPHPVVFKPDMDVYEAISVRKSVRKFQDKDIPEEVLTRLFAAARLAPSASNRQEWRFVVSSVPTPADGCGGLSWGEPPLMGRCIGNYYR